MSAQQKSRVDEDDDLDDLDDVLDQFSPPAQPTATSHPPPANTSASTSAAHSNDALTEELTAEFAREMESLLGELRTAPRWGSEGSADRERLAATWEAMLVEDMNATVGASSASADASSSGTDFQSRIRSTQNRLRERESELQPPDASASGDAETLEKLLSQLKGLENLAGEGADSDEQLQGVLEEMMGQLMGKDVLYEPLKELHEKFPGYLAKHASTISAADKARYEAQVSCIKRLIDEFEAPTYRDEDDKVRERIVGLMGELQTHGSPPEEIMGPLPPGFSMGTDGLPEMPDGCKMN